MISFTLGEIAGITGGRYSGPKELLDRRIQDATIDSRTVRPGCLFVPIVGDRFDGHDFIPQAIDKGAIAVLAENEKSYTCPVIYVDSTIKALLAMAKAYRAIFDIPVVGITGSTGKTTTKELVANVLSQKFNTLKNERSFNNHTGVPLTLLRLNQEHRAAVIEMGTNTPGEIAALADIVRPTIGVITNIGEAHIEFFGTRDGILKEKSDIFKYIGESGRAIVNGDDDKLRTLRGKLKNVLTYGLNADNDIRGENVKDMGLEGMRFDIVYGGGRITATIPSPGIHMVMNSLCAAAVGLTLGIEPELIKQGIESYAPVEGRMQIIKTQRLTLLDDSFNANPTSMAAAINIACRASGRTVLILGDMLELGEKGAEYHRDMGKKTVECGADMMIGKGPLMKNACEETERAGIETMHFDTSEDIMRALDNCLRDGDTVLVKASHGTNLKDVAEYIKVNF